MYSILYLNRKPQNISIHDWIVCIIYWYAHKSIKSSTSNCLMKSTAALLNIKYRRISNERSINTVTLTEQFFKKQCDANKPLHWHCDSLQFPQACCQCVHLATHWLALNAASKLIYQTIHSHTLPHTRAPDQNTHTHIQPSIKNSIRRFIM